MRNERVPPPQPGGLTQEVASNAAWSFAQNIGAKVTGLITVLILARLLSPTDFGVVTIASALIPFLQIFADLGITIYILQHPQPSKRVYDTYFWSSFTIGIVGSIVFVTAAPALAQLFNEPTAAPIMQGMAPVALLVTLGAVPQTMLRRELRLRALAIQGTIAVTIGQAVAIVSAFLDLGAWALVLQNIVHAFLSTVLAWISSRYRPSFRFSWSEFVTMVRFGWHYVIGTGAQAAAQWLISVIIAQTLGLTALGYLNIVQRLTSTASDFAVSAVLQLTTVAFARIREDAARLRAGFVRAFGVLYALQIPIMVMLATASPALIPLLYGGKWDASIVPGSILAIATVFAVDGVDHALWAGIGRPSLWSRYVLISSVIAIGATWAGAQFSLEWVLWATLAADVLFAIGRWIVTGRQVGLPWWRLAARFAAVAAPGAIAACAGFAVAWLTGGLLDIVRVALIVLTVAVLYTPFLRVFARPTWDEYAGLARSILGRFARRRAASEA